MPKRVRRIPRKSSRTYHHGNLKPALIAAATAILREQGPQALTLRAAATATGVTAPATYRHFKDRRELIAAVAEAGFAALRDAMVESAQSAQGRLGLKHVAIAYVHFALEHPAEYRVMFGPELADTDDLPELRGTARSVLRFVGQGISQLQAGGLIRAGDPDLMAVATWASLHGLVMLILDRQALSVAPSVDALVEEVTQVLMFGMAKR